MKKIFGKLTSYQRIAFLFLLPVCILISSIAVNIQIYNRNYNALLKESVQSKLEGIFMKNESIAENIVKSVNVLETNEYVMEYLKNQASLENQAKIDDVMNALNALKKNYDYIESVSLVNRDEKFVITHTGIYDFQKYFEEVHCYASYNIAYWRSFRLYGLAAYQKQPPSIVQTGGAEKYIIPLVFCQLGDTKLSNYIIVNLDIEAMLKSINSGEEMASIHILSKMDGQSFGIDREIYRENIRNSELYYKITESELNGFECIENSKKIFVVSYTPSTSLLDYCYYAEVPYHNILVNQLLITTALFNCLIVICVMVLTRFGISYVVKPLKTLVMLFQDDRGDNGYSGENRYRVFQHLQAVGQRLVEENAQLKSKYDSALPFVQERVVNCILNAEAGRFRTEDIAEEERLKDIFVYSYFSIIMMQLNLKPQFFDIYPGVDDGSINRGFYSVAREMFEEEFEVLVLSREKDVYCMLLNVEKPFVKEKIAAKFQEIKNILTVDKEYLELYGSYSNIYVGMEGLKKAYAESQNSFQLILGEKLEDTVGVHYYFKRNDEQKLYHLVAVNKILEAKELILSVLSHNQEMNINAQSMQMLYQYILYIVLNVMNEKEMLFNETREPIENAPRWSSKQIHKEIFALLDSIEEAAKGEQSQTRKDALVCYVGEHYAEELSLDVLASHFSLKPKYVSRIFKEWLGIGFSDYLAALRIDKAKELLKNTEAPLSEIYPQTGFNNKTTFIRTFKKNTGLTPTEYRSAHKKET